MNTTRLVLLCFTGLIAVSCADFVQLLSGPLANPQYTLTFDDIPAQSLPVWNYLWYNNTNQHVGIGQAFGAIINSSANYWASNTPWFDQPYKPGHFHTLYGDYLDYNFNPPIKMFSAKSRATTNNIAKISVKLINGTEIAGRVIAQFSYSNINRYDYYGFNSSVPIANVFIRGGSVNVDDVQYTTVCPDGAYFYNSTTGQCVVNDIDECATGAFVCSPNARCINTPGSYLCQCNADYEGNGKNCTLYSNLTFIDYALDAPQDTITFDELPLGTIDRAASWNVIWFKNGTFGVSQLSATVTNAVSNNWNGAAPWYDQPTHTPGNYYVMTENALQFFFNPPIKTFSAKMRATSGAPFIAIYADNGWNYAGLAIGYHNETVTPPSSTNRYGYYGFDTSIPISILMIQYGLVNIDDFQFITACANKTATYDYITKTCT